jgi:hypothetical protein
MRLECSIPLSSSILGVEDQDQPKPLCCWGPGGLSIDILTMMLSLLVCMIAVQLVIR